MLYGLGGEQISKLRHQLLTFVTFLCLAACCNVEIGNEKQKTNEGKIQFPELQEERRHETESKERLEIGQP